jgi:hypothetical protein
MPEKIALMQMIIQKIGKNCKCGLKIEKLLEKFSLGHFQNIYMGK